MKRHQWKFRKRDNSTSIDFGKYGMTTMFSAWEKDISYEPKNKKKLNWKPKIRDKVHIKEDSPQGQWKLGKLEQLIQNDDVEISAAKVRISNWSLSKRSLNVLHPMELAGINETDHSNNKAEKEKIEGTNQDNSVDNEILKWSRVGKRSSKGSITVT